MDKKQTLNQDWLEKYAHRVIEHMNEDHQNTIVSTLNAQLKIEDPEARMVELRSDGYFVVSNGSRFFLKLEKECQVKKQERNLLSAPPLFSKFLA